MKPYSVLMSVYRKESPANLRQSIDSMLNQTVKTNDFVLICDGALTPELDQVIVQFEHDYPDVFHVVRLSENQGLGKALNQGIPHCRNEIIARMDSDDIALPVRCERQLEAMENHSADIVSADIQEFLNDDVSQRAGKRALAGTHADIVRFAKRRNPFNHPCTMFRKQAAVAAGMYQDFYLFEDYHLWIRMLAAGAKGHNIPETLLLMRAGSDLYKRRGGLRYACSMSKFRWFMKRTGFISWFEFFSFTPIQFLICIIPNRLREIIYKILLRS